MLITTDLASVAVPNMIKTDAGCYFGTLMILNILIGIAFVICGCLAGIIGFVVSKNM